MDALRTLIEKSLGKIKEDSSPTGMLDAQPTPHHHQPPLVQEGILGSSPMGTAQHPHFSQAANPQRVHPLQAPLNPHENHVRSAFPLFAGPNPHMPALNYPQYAFPVPDNLPAMANTVP